MALFGRRGGAADVVHERARRADRLAEEHARHEAAAQAVRSFDGLGPPAKRARVRRPPRASQGAAPGRVSPAAMRAMRMPDLPPSADLPARGGNFERRARRGRVRVDDGRAHLTIGKLVVVKFGASWCTHCAGMLPAFGDASRKRTRTRTSYSRTSTPCRTPRRTCGSRRRFRFSATVARWTRWRRSSRGTSRTACGSTRARTRRLLDVRSDAGTPRTFERSTSRLTYIEERRVFENTNRRPDRTPSLPGPASVNFTKSPTSQTSRRRRRPR